jgi:hypothetical protein
MKPLRTGRKSEHILWRSVPALSNPVEILPETGSVAAALSLGVQ